jgi:hypothetical protein
LIFGNYFKSNYPGQLYENHGSDFNHPVDNLPSHMTHLVFGTLFADDILRTQISDGDAIDFNQPIHHLPSSIRHLALGNDFSWPVNHLPSSLTYLSVGIRNQPNELPLFPTNLTHLKLTVRSYSPSYHKAPVLLPHPHVTHLFVNTTPATPFPLLPSLTHLNIGKDEEIPTDLSINTPKLSNINFTSLFHSTLPIVVLPPSTTHLYFPYQKLCADLVQLPLLTFIAFGKDFNQPVESLLPPSVKSLIFGFRFDRPLGHLPNLFFLLFISSRSHPKVFGNKYYLTHSYLLPSHPFIQEGSECEYERLVFDRNNFWCNHTLN